MIKIQWPFKTVNSAEFDAFTSVAVGEGEDISYVEVEFKLTVRADKVDLIAPFIHVNGSAVRISEKKTTLYVAESCYTVRDSYENVKRKLGMKV